MTFSKTFAILGVALLAAGCGNSTTTYSNQGSDSSSNSVGSGYPYPGPTGDSSGVSGLTNGATLTPISGNNVMQMTVNGSLCSAATSDGYVNKPCVSVTICSPTGADCQTIDDVLLDTGSYGLRVFSTSLGTALVDALTPVTVSSGNSVEPLAECAQFGDGSADWGPVEMAQVGLGSEARVSVPIQIINSKYVGMSTNCSSAATTGDTPEDAGYNAILGVGLFAQDCGDGCAPGYQDSAQNGMYFACGGSTCSGTAVSAADQVTNPVSALSRDNNGVILELPSVELGGESSVNGYVVLGIGTESNNMPDGVTAYPADSSYGEFSTSFSGQTYSQSFVDSGSNALYFQPPSNKSSELPDCSDGSGFLCPSSTVSLTASSSGYNGSPTSQVAFYVGNADNLNGSYNVFSELAGDMGDGGVSFDWGLPFFFGRNVYVGIANTSSSLGEGPYWAY